MCSPLGGATEVHTTPYKYDAKLCPMILSCSACASPSVLRARPDTTVDTHMDMHKCLATPSLRQDKDRAKSTHSMMAFTERGLGVKRAHANSSTVSMQEG